MKVTLLVEFNIPPHRNHTAESASIVADVVQRVLRANTEPATEVSVALFPVALFTPPTP